MNGTGLELLVAHSSFFASQWINLDSGKSVCATIISTILLKSCIFDSYVAPWDVKVIVTFLESSIRQNYCRFYTLAASPVKLMGNMGLMIFQ